MHYSPFDSKLNRAMLIYGLFYGLCGTAAALIIAGCGGGGGSTFHSVTVTQTIPATGGTLASQDTTLTFPNGWATSATSVSISSTVSVLDNFPKSTLGDYVGGAQAPGYLLSPTGLTFAPPGVEISIAYNGASVSPGYKIKIADVGTGQYIPATTVANGIASANVLHFSPWTVVAVNPFTGSYTGTAMDSMGHTPSFKGTVSLDGTITVTLSGGGAGGVLTGTVNGAGTFTNLIGTLTGAASEEGSVMASGQLTMNATAPFITGTGNIAGINDSFTITSITLVGNPIQ